MGPEDPGSKGRHSLAFLALLSFLLAFSVARLFTSIFPDTVVVSGGVHFHHFWYGLAMIVVAGWLGIASNRPELDRVYAVVFGFGAGLIADEVGLLLTLGDYYSELTYVFVVGAVAVVALIMLVLKYQGQLERDLSIGRDERTLHIGIYVIGLSTLALAFDFTEFGAAMALVGTALIFWGYLGHRRAAARAS